MTHFQAVIYKTRVSSDAIEQRVVAQDAHNLWRDPRSQTKFKLNLFDFLLNTQKLEDKNKKYYSALAKSYNLDVSLSYFDFYRLFTHQSIFFLILVLIKVKEIPGGKGFSNTKSLD